MASCSKRGKRVSLPIKKSDSLPGSSKNIASEHTFDEKTRSSSFNPSKYKSSVRSELSNSVSSLPCSKDNASKQIFEETNKPSFRPCKRLKNTLVQKTVSSASFSEETFDKATTNNSFKSCEPKELPSFPLSIIESRLKNFNLEKGNTIEIFQLIANRCNYILTEILKTTTDYMKKCGRLQFTIEDFNHGLNFSGLNLENLSSEAEDKKAKSKDKKKKKTSKGKRLKSISDASSSQATYVNEKWLNDSDPLCADIKNLAGELQSYFEAVMDIVNCNREEKGCIVANNLLTNQNLTPLIPHLVNFFCEALDNLNFDFLKVSLVFKFIDALFKNPFVYFGQDCYLNVLLCAFFKFIATDLSLPSQDITDCCCLKDAAANILALILKRSKCQHQYCELTYLVNSILTSVDDSINVYYGALAALNALGIPAIILLLPSYIEQFYNEDVNYSTLDAHLIQGQIIHLYYVLVDYYLKIEVKNKNLKLRDLLKSKFIFPDYLRNVKVLPVLLMLEKTLSRCAGEALQPIKTRLLNAVSHSTSLRERETTKQALKGRKRCLTNYSLLLGTII